MTARSLLDCPDIKSIRPPSFLGTPPKPPETAWWRVTAPHLCAALEAHEETGKVLQAAPILRWTIGKNIRDVLRWVDRKGYRIELLRGLKP